MTFDPTRVVGKEIAEALNRGDDPTGQRAARERATPAPLMSAEEFSEKVDALIRRAHAAPSLDHPVSGNTRGGAYEAQCDRDAARTEVMRLYRERGFVPTAKDVELLGALADDLLKTAGFAAGRGVNAAGAENTSKQLRALATRMEQYLPKEGA